MRCRVLLILAGLLAGLAGCQKIQYKVVAELPPPVFGQEQTGYQPTGMPAWQRQMANQTTGRAAGQGAASRTTANRDFDPAWEQHAADNGWRYIIVHHSAGPTGNAAIFDHEHRVIRGWDELGYHFVIGNGTRSGDGEIEIGSRWVKQKWGAHCKTNDERFNNFGIGICLVGDFEGYRPTAAQLASLQRLVAYLADRYRIPNENILGHREAVALAPGEKRGTKCPGRFMDMDGLRATIRRLASRFTSMNN